MLSLLRFSSGDRVTAASGSDVPESRGAFYPRGRSSPTAVGSGGSSTSALEEELPEEATRKAMAKLATVILAADLHWLSKEK